MVKLKRLAIISEFIYFSGGIEKSILILMKELEKRKIGFDVYAGIYDAEKTYPEFRKYKVNVLMKKKLPSAINSLYMRHIFRNLKLKGYDGFIFFGSHSLAAAKNNHPNVWWSTRPLAYLYGLDGKGPDSALSIIYKNNYFKKAAIIAYLKILKLIDKRDIKGVDSIKVVGPLAKYALKNAYPLKQSEILYAPVDMENITISKNKPGKYYLSVARHVPDKNVDRIVSAFVKMPNKILYQVGAGPDTDKLKSIAKGAKNIKFLGFLDESALRKIVSESIATISASENEDYSMNLMESVAAGRPTISVNTDRTNNNLVKTKTGILIPSSNPEEIMGAVKKLSSKEALSLRSECLRQGKIFSKENFVSNLLSTLDKQRYFNS